MATLIIQLGVLVPCILSVSPDDRTSSGAGARVVRSRVSPLPERLARRGRTPAGFVLPSLDIALVSGDYAGLQRQIEDRADPRSANYARWLSTDEVTDWVAASPLAIATVTAWVRSHGLAPVLNNHRDFVTIRGVNVSSVERLLGTAMHQHFDARTGRTVPRIAGDYHLPADVAPHVMKILPVHSVPATPASPRRGAGDCAAALQVECGTERRDRLACAPCAGLRLAALRGAGCSNQQIALWCAGSTGGNWPQDCTGLEKPGMITPAVTRQRYNYTLPAAGSKPLGSVAAMLPGPVGVVPREVAYIQSDCGVLRQ